MSQNIPASITANFAFSFDVTIPDITSLPENSVAMSLRGPATHNFESTPINNGVNFSGTLSIPGRYRYTIFSTDAYDAKSLIATGDLEVAPDPTLIADDSDLRTYEEKLLAAIEAVLLGRASKDQESYSIAGRTLTHTPIPILQKLREEYLDKVKKQRGKFPRRVLSVFRNY